MSLPAFVNYQPATDYNSAALCSDTQRLLRIRIKRRYYSSGDQFDSNWMTVTSYLLNQGLSEISWGLDDQEWITGVTKNANVSFNFDNSQRAFNDNTDNLSLWSSTTGTTYYINNSLIEVDFGFQMPTGTTYYETFFSGLLKQDTLQYDKSAAKITAYSKLDYLNNYTLNDIFLSKRVFGVDSVGGVDAAFNFLNSNLPSDLSLTFVSNAPRANIIYNNTTDYNTTLFNFISNSAKNSGSIFGLDNSNRVFLTYFGNSLASDTIDSLPNDSNTALYYQCNTFATYLSGTVFFTSKCIYPTYTGNAHFWLRLPSQKYDSTSTTSKFGDRVYIASGTEMLTFDIPVANDTSGTFEILYKISNIKGGMWDLWNSSLGSFESGLNIPVLSWESYNATGSVSSDNSIFAIGYLQSGGFGYFDFSNSSSIAQTDNFGSGDGLWRYLAVVNDKVNNERRIYINGLKLKTVSNYRNIATTVFRINTQSVLSSALNLGQVYKHDLIVDRIRFSNVAKTDAEVEEIGNRIFRNQFTFSTSNVFTFTNYRSECNVIDIVNYDQGFNRIYNVALFDKEKNDIWQSEFYVEFNTVSAVLFRSKLDTYNSVSVSTVTELKTFFNSFDNYYCTLTGNNVKVSSDLNNRDIEAGMIKFWGYTIYTIVGASATVLTSTSIPSVYSSSSDYNVMTLCSTFINKDKQNQYVFESSLSVQKYGRRIYKSDLVDVTYSMAALMASSILSNSDEPKIRMTLKTRFAVRNFNLLDRVQVKWQADYTHNNTPQWSGIAFENSELVTSAGPILWTEKDFYVLGINHSFNDNTSQFLLREV